MIYTDLGSHDHYLPQPPYHQGQLMPSVNSTVCKELTQERQLDP